MRIIGPAIPPQTAFTTDVLAYKRWLLRGGRPGSPEAAMADWLAAARVRHEMIAEAAYFRWIGRNRVPRDPRDDWFDAEKSIRETLEGDRHRVGPEAATRLRRQLVAEAAYRHWEDRGDQPEDPRRDWDAAEAEVPGID